MQEVSPVRLQTSPFPFTKSRDTQFRQYFSISSDVAIFIRFMFNNVSDYAGNKVTVNRFFANIEVFFRATFIKCIFLLTDFIQMMKNKPNVRYLALGALLILVWLTQLIPALATIYSQTVYPVISYILSSFSGLFPFAIGDLFIFLSIAGVIVYPFYARSPQEDALEENLTARRGIPVMDLCMVLSGLGTELFSEELSTNEQKFRIPPILPRISRNS